MLCCKYDLVVVSHATTWLIAFSGPNYSRSQGTDVSVWGTTGTAYR